MSVALILAGGLGKRLRPLTENTPKPLLPVGGGRRILDVQLEWLRLHGFSEVFLLVGYLKEKIVEYVGSGEKWGLSVSYIVENEPLGTGGALRNASQVLAGREPVLVVNGDVITNIDPRIIADSLKRGALASIAVVPLKAPYGIVDLDPEGRVARFREKPVLPEYWINAGVYALAKSIIDYLPEKGNLEDSTFPKLAEKRLLAAVKFPTPPYYWRSIDSFKDLDEAAADLENLRLRIS